MSKVRIPGVGKSEGMIEGQFKPFPKGDYLIKVKSIEVEDKEGPGGDVVGVNFAVVSEVLGCENLPKNENPREYVGKEYRNWIFVMSPAHPSYANVTKIGGTVGEIGLASLKSFLDSAGVKIVKDEFDEQKAIGSWIEISVGPDSYVDNKTGEKRESNRIYSFKAHTDETAEAEATADVVVFEDDDPA